MNEREIDGYMVRVVPTPVGKVGHVSLEWRDHVATEEATARGESHLMGFHDVTVPTPVLLEAAAMVKGHASGPTDFSKLPDQPMYRDADGTVRFVENRIVGFMLDLLRNARTFDLNILASMVNRGMFTAEEYAQFSQLHGYSVSGFGELSQAPAAIVERCDRAAATFDRRTDG